MLDPASRPSPSTKVPVTARWTTIVLLCAVVLAASTRNLPSEERGAQVAQQSAVAESDLNASPASLPLEPLPIVPDFLEPLPIIEPSAMIVVQVGPDLMPPPPMLEPLRPVTEAPPEIDEPPSEPLPPVDEFASEFSKAPIPSEVTEPLPSDAIPAEVELVLPIGEGNEATEPVKVTEPTAADEFNEYDDEHAETAAQITLDELLTFSPSVAEISQKMLPEVQAAFQLAKHGATHAARDRFIHILRRIAQAKDVEEMTERYMRSLDEGLRALDEANDFMPVGGALTFELNAIAATHQTPMLKINNSRYTLPHEAVALYHRYAQQKLGAAVAGEQAGSMALHGLGKIHARWAETEENKLVAMRHSMTMYRAALIAHPRNHLAANELGVMLARSGRYDQAVVPLEWAAQLAGTATIYHNLAVVQQNRGELALAAAAKLQADRLAMLERTSGEVSRRHGVQWVAPQDFARVSDAHLSAPQPESTIGAAPTAPSPAPSTATRQPTVTPAPRGGTWR